MDQINNQPAKNCELCDVSQNAITKLKANNQSQPNNPKKSIWKWVVLSAALIVLAGLIYYYLANSFSKAQESNNLNNNQLIDDDKEKPQIGFLAPDFVAEDVAGNQIALSGFRGQKPVLLIFWATWCGYCAKELPNLKIFTDRYQDRIQILAIASGEPRKTIKDYILEKDINFLMLLDEQREIWNQYLIRGTPAHFLLNKQGNIVTLRPGLAPLSDLEVMMTMIER